MTLVRIETFPVTTPDKPKEEKTARRAKPQAGFPSDGELLEAPKSLQRTSLLLVPFYLEGAQTLKRVKSDTRILLESAKSDSERYLYLG